MVSTIDTAPLGAMPSPSQGTGANCGPLVAELARLSMGGALALMSPERARGAMSVVDWLLSWKKGGSAPEVVELLCAKLTEAGVPLDRYGSSTSMITSEHDAVGRIWRRGEGVETSVYVSPEDEDPEYLASPFFASAEARQWVEIWLPTTPDTRFGIVASLRAQAITHYLCVPIWLTNGANGWITFATRRATGFDRNDLLTLVFVLPALSARINSGVGWMSLDKLLRTYVGDEPHTAILSGRAKRGQVTTIEAAILIADLRDSTGHTAGLSALEAVDLFNNLFDCLVPPVETRRGEVLKYLGDGLLAMFRDTDYGGSACDRAFDAAEAALAAVQAFNRANPDRRAMQVGIALHHGTIAYGNVGSGSRLDFTMIGRDVGLASRIAGMNARLNRPLLLSASFVQRLSRGADRVGIYPARGFDQPVEVFQPARNTGTDGPARVGTSR